MKTVNIKGRPYPVRFNMAAFYEIQTFAGLDITEFLDAVETLQPAALMKLQFLGLKFGSDAAGKRFNMTYSDFIDFMGEDERLREELANIVMEDFKVLIEIGLEKIKLREEKNAPKEEFEQKKTITSGPSTSD